MESQASTLWWVMAGVLVAAELASGTFYLLMVALGAVAGALCAHAGLGATAQLAVAAVVAGAATLAWHLKRRAQPAPAPPGANPDLNLDVGSEGQVLQGQPDGTTRVTHRGASWSARHAGGGAAPAPGPHRIVAVEGGSRLVLAPLTRP
jgi:membrane protein implicated in regulation of membrane protease activity